MQKQTNCLLLCFQFASICFRFVFNLFSNWFQILASDYRYLLRYLSIISASLRKRYMQADKGLLSEQTRRKEAVGSTCRSTGGCWSRADHSTGGCWENIPFDRGVSREADHSTGGCREDILSTGSCWGTTDHSTGGCREHIPLDRGVSREADHSTGGCPEDIPSTWRSYISIEIISKLLHGFSKQIEIIFEVFQKHIGNNSQHNQKFFQTGT